MLKQFGMEKKKLIQPPFMTNCKLLNNTSPQNDVDLEAMQAIPFQKIIKNFMYIMNGMHKT